MVSDSSCFDKEGCHCEVGSPQCLKQSLWRFKTPFFILTTDTFLKKDWVPVAVKERGVLLYRSTRLEQVAVEEVVLCLCLEDGVGCMYR